MPKLKTHRRKVAGIAQKKFNANDFRAELQTVMSGYEWTVHRQIFEATFEATGIQSSGFNRLSTLSVIRREKDGGHWYEVKSSGYGLKAEWLHHTKGKTLRQALRYLQDYYEAMEQQYRVHASRLEIGRQQSAESPQPAASKEGDCHAHADTCC